MKIFISSDIEGVSGITSWDATRYGGKGYEEACRQMSLETAAACRAALKKGCEVVCECLDQADQKAMLVESLLLGTGCTVVSCSGMAGFGSSNEIVTRKRMRRLYVCGDGVSEASEGPGLTAARVMVCAGHVANMAIRLLLGEDKP